MKLLELLSGWLGHIISFKWLRLRAIINGGLYYRLTETDHDEIRKILSKNYFIILTRRRGYLVTYLITLLSSFVDRKISHYTHALMNVEGDLDGHIGFKLVEATSSKGVHYTTFMNVFDCDSVVLLAPKNVPIREWTLVLDKVKDDIGKGYDSLFDMVNDQKVSCVEMVYCGLKQLPDFETKFPKLIKLIKDRGNNLTPQMLYDTKELDVIFEVRR